MIDTFEHALPHGITLSCRAAGPTGAPVLLFLHGFPEAAFVWDPLLLHFSRPENGGWRCVAPNLRGYGQSSRPPEVQAYKARLLVQDLRALIALESPKAPLGALVAHDWGGAVAWSLANQHPELMQRLVIINSPHPGAFVRELRHNPAQLAASAYMNFLIQPGAEERLAENDFARLWGFFQRFGAQGEPAWLSEDVKNQYRAVWRTSLRGGCNYYQASPLRPGDASHPGAAALELPDSLLQVSCPTQVLWGLGDHALLPGLLDGLDAWVPRLQVRRHDTASHWIVHEDPAWVMQQIQGFLAAPIQP